MAFLSKQILLPVIVIVLVILLNLNLSFAHSSGSCASEVHEDHGPSHAHHHCDHEIGHRRHDHHHQQDDREMVWKKKLPEELAEEENLKLLGFASDHHDHEHKDYSDLGLTGFGNSLTIMLLISWHLSLIDKNMLSYFKV